MDPAVLLIDDEPDYLATYADTLRPYGFEPVGVSTREEAILALDARRWDVIVLDERLRGPGSEHGAPALLAEIAARSPSARTIVLTAFATDDSVRRAIAAGAWDYLEKDARFLEHLLPLRVRHAAEMARQRRGMTPDERERALRDTWTSALSEQNAQRKGRLLEEALELLFVGTPGLTEVARNRRSSNEEFDLVVTNASTDPVLAKEGSFILVECKNWSTRVDPKELAHLLEKLRGRRGRFRHGILVSVNGFTAGVDTLIQRQANEDLLVLPMDRNDVTDWIDATDRIGWLKERVRRATLRE